MTHSNGSDRDVSRQLISVHLGKNGTHSSNGSFRGDMTECYIPKLGDYIDIRWRIPAAIFPVTSSH